MRGVGISLLYKSRMRNNQSAMNSREMKNITWRSVTLCFFSLHSSQLVVKNVMFQGEEKNSILEDVRQTRQTSPVRAEDKRTDRVRGSCHRSRSPTGLFVKSCMEFRVQPATVWNKLSRALEVHLQLVLRQEYQSLAGWESLEQWQSMRPGTLLYCLHKARLVPLLAAHSSYLCLSQWRPMSQSLSRFGSDTISLSLYWPSW